MATTAVDPVFADTNILVYSRIAQSSFRADALAMLSDLDAAGHPLWISRHILREYLVTMSRPGTLAVPPPMPSLIGDVRFFESKFLIAEDGPTVTSSLLHLLSSVACSGLQIHDANIVATMLAHGISKLLTHNVADFQRFSGHSSVIPLVP